MSSLGCWIVFSCYLQLVKAIILVITLFVFVFKWLSENVSYEILIIKLPNSDTFIMSAIPGGAGRGHFTVLTEVSLTP